MTKKFMHECMQNYKWHTMSVYLCACLLVVTVHVRVDAHIIIIIFFITETEVGIKCLLI